MNIDALNRLRDLIITWANQEGINLGDHFESPEDFKQWVIALAIRGITDAGVPFQKAFDFVLGEGRYQELANSIWEKLNR